MESFTSINVEVYIGSAWVSLTDDVLKSPKPRISGMGIMGDGPLDRVGGTGKFTFALNNSEANSVATRGYYSPGTARALQGWTTGLPVRIYFVYDGNYKTFYFTIDNDGIEVTPGIYGNRSVRVSCSNWMKEAENRTVDLLAYQTTKRGDEALQLVVNNMPRPPKSTSFQTGSRTFTTVFDVTSKKTKAISEMNKIALSEFGLIYLRGSFNTGSPSSGEVLVFEKRTYRYDNRTTPTSIAVHSTSTQSYLLSQNGVDRILLESGTTDKIILEAGQSAIFDEGDIKSMRVSYGKNIFNRVKLVSYPRKLTASQTLWNLENPITLAAGQTLSGLRSAYRDPNGKSTSVSAVSSTVTYSATANSLASGAGTNKTAFLTVSAEYGTSEVEYSLTNSDTSTIYVTALSFTGTMVNVYDAASVMFESSPSILAYGVNELNIDMAYVDDATTLFVASFNIDRILNENGVDRILMENSDIMLGDDTAGLFDILVTDEPKTWIDSVSFVANRDQFNMLAFMCLDAGSSITITEAMTGVTGDAVYWISGYDLEIDNGIVTWSPLLISAMNYPRV